MHLCNSSNNAISAKHMIWVQSYQALHSAATIHKTSEMTHTEYNLNPQCRSRPTEPWLVKGRLGESLREDMQRSSPSCAEITSNNVQNYSVLTMNGKHNFYRNQCAQIFIIFVHINFITGFSTYYKMVLSKIEMIFTDPLKKMLVFTKWFLVSGKNKIKNEIMNKHKRQKKIKYEFLNKTVLYICSTVFCCLCIGL
jgi:hypothetical protein